MPLSLLPVCLSVIETDFYGISGTFGPSNCSCRVCFASIVRFRGCIEMLEGREGLVLEESSLSDEKNGSVSVCTLRGGDVMVWSRGCGVNECGYGAEKICW